jgi:Fic family protein
VRGVTECARDGLRLADDLLALREQYHAAVRTSRASGHLATLIDQLFRVPSITIGQARGLLDVTTASASHNLRKLEALGIVREVTGRTRAQVFVARDILAFVGRDLSAPAEREGGA